MVIRTGKNQENKFAERNQQIVRDHLESGETYSVLANRYSISPARVRQILSKHGPETVCGNCGAKNRYLNETCFFCRAVLNAGSDDVE